MIKHSRSFVDSIWKNKLVILIPTSFKQLNYSKKHCKCKTAITVSYHCELRCFMWGFLVLIWLALFYLPSPFTSPKKSCWPPGQSCDKGGGRWATVVAQTSHPPPFNYSTTNSQLHFQLTISKIFGAIFFWMNWNKTFLHQLWLLEPLLQNKWGSTKCILGSTFWFNPRLQFYKLCGTNTN